MPASGARLSGYGGQEYYRRVTVQRTDALGEESLGQEPSGLAVYILHDDSFPLRVNQVLPGCDGAQTVDARARLLDFWHGGDPKRLPVAKSLKNIEIGVHEIPQKSGVFHVAHACSGAHRWPRHLPHYPFSIR